MRNDDDDAVAAAAVAAALCSLGVEYSEYNSKLISIITNILRCFFRYFSEYSFSQSTVPNCRRCMYVNVSHCQCSCKYDTVRCSMKKSRAENMPCKHETPTYRHR